MTGDLWSLYTTMTMWDCIRDSFRLHHNFEIKVPIVRSFVTPINDIPKPVEVQVITYRCVHGGYGGVPVARVFAHYPASCNKAPCPVAIYRLTRAGAVENR